MEKAGRPHWAGRGFGLRDRNGAPRAIAIRVEFLRLAPKPRVSQKDGEAPADRRPRKANRLACCQRQSYANCAARIRLELCVLRISSNVC